MSVAAKRTLKLRLLSKEKEAHDAFTLRFERRSLHWRAGQGLRFSLEGKESKRGGAGLRLGIASAPFESELQLLLRLSSAEAGALRDLAVGDAIIVEGVDGTLWSEDSARPLVIVAAGAGVAPMRSILYQLDHEGGPLRLDMFYLNRDENFIYGDELEDLVRRHRDARLHLFPGAASVPEGAFRTAVQDSKSPHYLVCGSESMVKATHSTLRRIGAPPDQTRSETIE